VELVWFLAGLGLGLGLLAGSTHRFNRQLERIVRILPSDRYQSALPPLSRLTQLTHHFHGQLQRYEQELLGWQDILYRSPMGYLQVNGTDNLYWINQRACDLLKIRTSPRELLPSCLLLEVVRSLELDQLIGQVRGEQQEQQIDWTLHLPEGSQEHPLRAYGIPLAAGHVGVFIEDRTEAKDLTEDRDRWTSDVAHELKTPLTSIRLMVEALAHQMGSQHSSQAERLLQEVIRLSDLVKDLLELSRITFHQSQTLKLQAENVPGLIHKAWLNLEPLAQQQNLSLYYQGLEEFTLDVDKNRLYRVFLNLLDNAIKYSPVDQPIIVEVEVVNLSSPHHEADQGLCIDIIDMGPGFPPEALPHIFKRFYRSDPSRVRPNTVIESSAMVSGDRRPPLAQPQITSLTLSEPDHQRSTHSRPPLGGSGLGLAIAQQIVLAHGGTIQAYNHPQMGGAWLRIELPCP